MSSQDSANLCEACPIVHNFGRDSETGRQATETLGKLAALGITCDNAISKKIFDPHKNPFSPIHIPLPSGQSEGRKVPVEVRCGIMPAISLALEERGFVPTPSMLNEIGSGNVSILEQNPLQTS